MKYIMKALIDGVVSIIKLIVILAALAYAYDTGIITDIINNLKPKNMAAIGLMFTIKAIDIIIANKIENQ